MLLDQQLAEDDVLAARLQALVETVDYRVAFVVMQDSRWHLA